MNIDEVNQRSPRCTRCTCTSELVWVKDDDDRASLYAKVAKDDFLGFVPAIRTMTSCSIGEAKATFMHVALSGRRCHWCKSELSEGAIVDCQRCKSLNLVWEAADIETVPETNQEIA